MLTTAVPTREELVRRATELGPLLAEGAARAERDRRLSEETIDALTAAGMFRLRVPRRFGGYEADSRTLVEVSAALGRADGSAAWITAVNWIPGWMACLFPDSVQEEVFSRSDVRVCGTLSPSAAAASVDGGVVVNGRWGFISGAAHAHWQVIVAMRTGVGDEPMPVMALVPMEDLRIIDDWETSGLRGTGSVTTVAENVFVPEERVMPLGAVVEGIHSSPTNADSPVYRAPLLPVAAASSVGPVLGMAEGALATFLERLPERGITYTGYSAARQAPITHLRVSEARLGIDRAGFHAHRLASRVDAKGADGSPWTVAERVGCRADLGAVCRLAKEAVDLLSDGSGGSAIYSHVPIQRFVRDVHAVNQHALMNPATNSELHGRILCGQEPNTLYI